ncbi:unnamed protein product [Arctogadus glacialis]
MSLSALSRAPGLASTLCPLKQLSEEVYPMSSYPSSPRSEEVSIIYPPYPYLLVVRSCGGKRTRLTSS